MQRADSRVVSIWGVNVRYVQAGEGPVVLLLHGLGSSLITWYCNIDALADAGFTVIAPDLPGYGDSALAPDPQTAESLAAVVSRGLGRTSNAANAIVRAVKCLVEHSSIQPRAVRDGDEWVINGSKMWITNALQADWLCLLVRTSDEGGYRGMSQVIVPTATPGFSVSKKLDKLGMRASDTGLLSFDDVRVPVANTIGVIGQGFQQQMQQFVVERMWAAYTAVGGCERALERTAEFLKERHVFGEPLIKKQYIQFTMAEMAAEVDLLREYCRSIARRYDAGEDTTKQATIAKLTGGRLVRKVADQCLQFHGGVGFTEEVWTARFFRDNRIMSIGGGADEVMLQVLAGMEGYT